MTILLTSTIDPNNCILTSRTNIEDRILDYYNVVSLLLAETDLEIVFVENSGHDLGKISEFIDNPRVEILQFDGNNYNRKFGKSFGEHLIINYAIIHSQKLKAVDYIMKLTGRYYIDFNFIKSSLSDDFVFYAKKRFTKTWLFSGFFKMPKVTWLKHFAGNIMIDSNLHTFERNLYNQLANSYNINYLPYIGLSGISGTRNNDINEGLVYVDKPMVLRKGSFITGLEKMIKMIDLESAKMVEVGSYTGESTQIFLDSTKFSIIYTVDPWKDYPTLKNCPMCIVEAEFDSKFSNNQSIVKIKSTSVDAVSKFDDESLDFVYLDGGHSYENLLNDISIWLPKIKPLGWIGGHDYHFAFKGVKQAVNESFLDFFTFEDTSWLAKKYK